jgi:hypothetical protein
MYLALFLKHAEFMFLGKKGACGPREREFSVRNMILSLYYYIIIFLYDYIIII